MVNPPKISADDRDGRDIDESIGVLGGEGARIVVDVPRDAHPTEGKHHGHPLAQRADETTYYGLPAIKEPVWISTIPAYFYVGGATGAALALAAATSFSGDDAAMRALGRKCRALGFAGAIVSSALLIADLGRPKRFLHMLRVFRPTSPMSVGSWVLVATGGAATCSFLPGPVGRASALAAGVLGAPLAGYTAVLLCNTAVPLWHSTTRTLPILFIASAITSAASLLDLVVTAPRETRVVRRFGIVGKVAELIAAELVARDASRNPRVGAPLHRGPSGALFRAAKLLTMASLGVALVPTKHRAPRVIAGILGTLGAVAVRFSIFHAGKASARDPVATFSSQVAHEPSSS